MIAQDQALTAKIANIKFSRQSLTSKEKKCKHLKHLKKCQTLEVMVIKTGAAISNI
jgi:hypothetical protein